MITGINVVRNCIENGYPWVESILSAYPMCDEYLVNDGGSTDGTRETLQQLQRIYPRIKIYHIPDTDNIRWDSVSSQINHLIHEAQGDIIFLGNADELIHEQDLQKVQQDAEETTLRILRFNRREITHNWSKLSEETYHPARIAKNIKGIYQNWNSYGGDEFLYDDGWPDPDRKYRMEITLYHLYNLFPENHLNKLRNDATYLAPGDITRVKTYECFKENERRYVFPENIYRHLPAIAKGLPYMGKYQVRECLFNKDWVETVTGLKY